MVNLSYQGLQITDQINPVDFVAENCTIWDNIILGSYQFIFITIVMYSFLIAIHNVYGHKFTYEYKGYKIELIWLLANVALITGWARIIQIFINLKFTYQLI